MVISREEVEKLLEKPRFVAWVSGQQSEAFYDYDSNVYCPLGKYLAANDLIATVGGWTFDVFEDEVWGRIMFREVAIPESLIHNLAQHPRTYGALLARLEEQ